MNIEDHFNAAEAYLEMANEKFERQDYTGSYGCLIKAHEESQELLNHAQQIIALKANVKLSEEGP